MKTKTFFLVLVVALLAAGGGWFAAKHSPAIVTHDSDHGRKILFYQSPMHPWIKSDKPGKCTICGMDLVPIYEGDKALDVQEGTVALSSNTINVLHVQTVEVQKQPLRRTLQVAGTVEDNDSRHRILSAYVDGRIDKLFVNYIGAEVVEGQPLATIYSTALLNTEREFISLLKRTPSQNSTELNSANQDLLAAAQQRLKQLGLTEKQIKGLAAKPDTDVHTEILAPMSGTVVTRHVYEGQYVKEGERLFELADFSIMWFLFDAYERDLTWLQIGQKVSVSTPAVPGKTFEGAIAFIDPNVKEMTRSAKVRVEIQNPLIESGGQKRRELLHKLYAQGTVHIETPDLLAVPRSAVLNAGELAVVYVDKKGGAYERRQVKLGRAGDDVWEILEGLHEGEKVVSTGNLLMDAQAQLNLTAQAGEGASESTKANSHSNSVALSAHQRQLLHSLLAAADKLSKALAADNLADFKTQSVALQKLLPHLGEDFKAAADWADVMERIETAGRFPEAPDLAAARKVFLPFSMAAADLAQAARSRDKDFSSVKVFQCPMVNQAVPGAPKRGLWVQASSPLRNPFFGGDMIDCGSEVK